MISLPGARMAPGKRAGSFTRKGPHGAWLRYYPE
jgi:hypothetical protein